MAVIDRFEIGGIFYDVQDTAATNKNTQQDAEIGSLQTRVSAVEQKTAVPNRCLTAEIRSFVTKANAQTWTAPADGIVKVFAMKRTSGNTVRLKLNGNLVDSAPYFGTDAGGTLLNFPFFAVTLSTRVNNGDQIVIDSDEAGAPSTDSWYVSTASFQYAV